jgi:hypothetical protein
MIHELLAQNLNKPDILNQFRRAWHEVPAGIQQKSLEQNNRAMHQDLAHQIRMARKN